MTKVPENIVHNIASSTGSGNHAQINCVVNTVKEETYIEVSVIIKKKFKLHECVKAANLYDTLLTSTLNIEDLL